MLQNVMVLNKNETIRDGAVGIKETIYSIIALQA